MDHETLMKQKVPESLTVTINLKWAESMKKAKLDINESTLVFEYPDLYYLDLNLKYKCDPDNGNAKFDKTKKTLTIKLPVVGLTEDSQKVMDEHYQKFVVEHQDKVKSLQTQGEVIEEKEEPELTEEQQQTRQAAMDKLNELQAFGGQSQSK